MAFGEDDLVGLFAAPPAGPAQPMAYRQGKVLAFNPVTLQNTVQVGGSVLTDIPVLGVAEATTIRVGSVVGIMTVGQTWAIIGRIVTPNTAEATDAITQLSQAIYSATITGAGNSTTTDPTFGDLDDVIGPVVRVEVRAGGKILVVLSAACGYAMENGARMGFELAGANTLAAANLRSLAGSGGFAVPAQAASFGLDATRVIQVDGLNPGTTIVTAKYNASTAAGTVSFANRTVSVFVL